MRLLIRDEEKDMSRERERDSDWKREVEREKAASGKDPLLSCTHYCTH